MREHVKSRGLLLEIIMTMLFFFVACAILLQIFAYSKTMGEQSLEKSRALNTAQNIAEHFLAGASYESIDFAPGETTLFLDETMKPANGQDTAYTAMVTVTENFGADGMAAADISIETAEGQAVHSLHIERYTGGRMGE